MIFSQTTRRGLIGAILGLGSVSVVNAALDVSAWRAYAGVEEDWIWQRHSLVVKEFPNLAGVAKLYNELRLAELQRRGLQFGHLSKTRPNALRGGILQFGWLPWTEKDTAAQSAADAEYAKKDRYIRSLTEALRQHPDYDILRQSQTKVWKLPEYKEMHRRYTGRLQELQAFYGGELGGLPAE